MITEEPKEQSGKNVYQAWEAEKHLSVPDMSFLANELGAEEVGCRGSSIVSKANDENDYIDFINVISEKKHNDDANRCYSWSCKHGRLSAVLIHCSSH